MKCILLIFVFTIVIYSNLVYSQSDSIKKNRGFSKENKPDLHFIPGPTINLSYGEFISSGIGFHLDNIILTAGNRTGHWKLYNFLVDYNLNYFFSKNLHLSEELGLTYFYTYIGLFSSNWKPLVNVNFSHHTNFTENSFAISPCIGITNIGLVEFRFGYTFYFEQQNELQLKNTINAGIFFRPLMKNHFAKRRPPILIRDIH